MTIDIFCDVIDNFGDAGVCWRLASIFSCEHGFPVKLYINDAETLSKITAGLDPGYIRYIGRHFHQNRPLSQFRCSTDVWGVYHLRQEL